MADEAKFALQSLLVYDGVASSFSVDTRRAIARKLCCLIGVPDVA
jgi:hypothetical protein